MPSLEGSTRLGVPGDRNARPLHALPASLGAYARLEAALQYHFTKSLTGKLFYVYKSFTKHDWQRETLTPCLGPCVSETPIFVGVAQKNYWTQIVGVTLKYKFEQARLPGGGRQGSPPVPELLMPHWGIDVPRRSWPPFPASP
jgi:hypothetical protein